MGSRRRSEPGTATNRSMLVRSLAYLKPTWKLQVLALFLTLITTALWVANPWIQKVLVDGLCAGASIRFLALSAVTLAGAAIGRVCMSSVQKIVFARIKERTLQNLRVSVIDSLSKKRTAAALETGSSEVISVLFQDIETMGGLYGDVLIQLLTQLLMLIAVTILMYILDPVLAVFILGSLVAMSFFVKDLTRPIQKASNSLQTSIAFSSNAVADFWDSLIESRLLGAQSFVRESVCRSLELLRKARVRFASILSLVSTTEAATWVLTGALLWFGGLKVIAGDMSLGSLLAFWNYMGLSLGPINTLLVFSSTSRASLGAAQRIFELTDRDQGEELDTGTAFPREVSTIELDNVSFGYGSSSYVLDGLSLRLTGFSKIGIVGRSGSGKSTLCSLLSRLHETRTGEIKINGIAYSELSIRSIRANLAVVQQSPHIFCASALDNIRVSRLGSSFAEIKSAAGKALVLDFIEEMPEGFDTMLGEGHRQISGGQRQRIAMARLFLRNPKMIILDEALSAVDPETAQKIMETLFKEFHDIVIIIISHHAPHLERAEKLFVLDDGRLREVSPIEAFSVASESMQEEGDCYSHRFFLNHANMPMPVPNISTSTAG